MRVIIFGATGTVGKQVVLQALGLGYQVRAFVRSPGSLAEIGHKDLEIFKGDVLNAGSVMDAVRNQDAVICVLGAGKNGGVRATGTRHIIAAMEKLGVHRLICQSTLGAGDSRPNLNFLWKYIMFGWLLRDAYQDHQLQEQYVKESRLDWTIVRPAAFTNGPATGIFKHGFSPTEKSITLKISRADVAMFLLMQLESDQYLRKTPGLSY